MFDELSPLNRVRVKKPRWKLKRPPTTCILITKVIGYQQEPSLASPQRLAV